MLGSSWARSPFYWARSVRPTKWTLPSKTATFGAEGSIFTGQGGVPEGRRFAGQGRCFTGQGRKVAVLLGKVAVLLGKVVLWFRPYCGLALGFRPHSGSGPTLDWL